MQMEAMCVSPHDHFKQNDTVTISWWMLNIHYPVFLKFSDLDPKSSAICLEFIIYYYDGSIAALELYFNLN